MNLCVVPKKKASNHENSQHRAQVNFIVRDFCNLRDFPTKKKQNNKHRGSETAITHSKTLKKIYKIKYRKV